MSTGTSPRSSTTELPNDGLDKIDWLKFRLTSGFFAYFLCGWGDGVTGTVLPYFTADFHLNPMTSSLLFTGSTCGVMHAMFFVMVGKKGGYAVTFLAYALSALARSFITGVGGIISPIICQAIVAKGVPWPHFYFGSLVLSGINCVLLFVAFRPTTRETAREWKDAIGNRADVSLPSLKDEKLQLDVAPPSSRSNTLHLVLRMPYQWAFCFFALLYSGGETTIQGFTVTYLLGARHANPKTAGYVTSGYWGGFALARFIWGFFVPQ
ncbi:hypothetical protein DXG01_000988 [Tephrocybe rancida]|nr:hypothetical protein DXG01_000988 [Tephrocybe rancida]